MNYSSQVWRDKRVCKDDCWIYVKWRSNLANLTNVVVWWFADSGNVENGPWALAYTFAKISEVDFVAFWTMDSLGTTQVPTMYRCFNLWLRDWQHRSRDLALLFRGRHCYKTRRKTFCLRAFHLPKSCLNCLNRVWFPPWGCVLCLSLQFDIDF